MTAVQPQELQRTLPGALAFSFYDEAGVKGAGAATEVQRPVCVTGRPANVVDAPGIEPGRPKRQLYRLPRVLSGLRIRKRKSPPVLPAGLGNSGDTFSIDWRSMPLRAEHVSIRRIGEADDLSRA